VRLFGESDRDRSIRLRYKNYQPCFFNIYTTTCRQIEVLEPEINKVLQCVLYIVYVRRYLLI